MRKTIRQLCRSTAVLAALAFGITAHSAALCSEARAEGLALEYQVSQKQVSGPNPDLKPVGENPSGTDKNSAGLLKVLLGQHCYREDSGHPQVYDFTRKNCYQIKDDGKTYSQTSLYSLVAFVDTEIRNRQMLGSLLAHSGLEARSITTFDQLWAAIELGVTMPGAPENPGITISQTDSEIVCTYKDKVLTRVKLGEPLSQNKEMYDKFLVYNMRLHPLIRDRIASTGKLCKEIDFLVARPSGAIDCVSMRLNKAEPTKESAELAPGLKRAFESGVLEQFQKEILSDPKTWTMPGRDTALKAAEKYADGNDCVDAALTLAEYSLCTGDHAATDRKDLTGRLEENKEVKLLFNQPSNSGKEAVEEALKRLNGIDSEKLEKAYVLDIFKGDLMDLLHQDASDSFINALKHNNLLTGVYRDLGDFYAERYETVKAWECYELARRLNPSHPLLEPVNKREQRLEREHAEFF